MPPTKQQIDKAIWLWADTTEPENVSLLNVETAYRMHIPHCKQGSCRRNCKGNPHCLGGLGEKEWLGEIDDSNWHDLEDPNNERRKEGSFVGLKNLGATCYVNTLLQVWFHNKEFRSAIYKWKNPEDTSPKIPDRTGSICEGTSDVKIQSIQSDIEAMHNEGDKNPKDSKYNPKTLTNKTVIEKADGTFKANDSPTVNIKESSNECLGNKDQITLDKCISDQHNTKTENTDDSGKDDIITDIDKTPKPHISSEEDLQGQKCSTNKGDTCVKSGDTSSAIQTDSIAVNNDTLQDLTPTGIPGHLQLIFALLQFSNRRYIDPTPFINCLGLDAGQQQDAQEFSKLFISLLEDTLVSQPDPTVKNVIREQFSGQYAYVTQCNHCQGGSQRSADFYELDLNIKGHKELHECLQEFCQEEKLEGDNQYMCAVCNSKQDARRRIQLCRLPPVLNLQLLRFVFDRQTGHKKKLNTFIQFPEEIDLTPHLNAPNKAAADHSYNSQTPNTGDCIYELSAVLIHRGPSAYSGHYIAHIKDYSSGTWYKFNDEEIVKMEGKNLQLGNEDEVSGGKASKKPRCTKGSHASKNAYMLVYRRKQLTQEDNSQEMAVCDPGGISDTVQEYVMRDNENFEHWVEEMTAMKASNITSGRERQQEIQALYCILPANQGDDYTWIHTDWLTQWMMDSVSANKRISPVTMTPFLCSHNKLDPEKVPRLKCISPEAGDIIYTKYGGDVRLTSNSMCIECVREKCRVIRTKARLTEDSKFIQQEQKNKQMFPNSRSGYWVGKESLRSWKRLVLENLEDSRNTVPTNGETRDTLSNGECNTENNHPEGHSCMPGSSTEQDHPPVNTEPNSTNEMKAEKNDTVDHEGAIEKLRFNEDLLCIEHDQLVIDEKCRSLVSEEVWGRLRKYFPDCPQFKYDVEPCPLCKKLLVAEEELKVLHKNMAVEQKSALNDLYLDKNRPKWSKNVSQLNIISQDLIDNWRRFIKSPTSKSPPDAICNTPLLCPHGGVMFEPDLIGIDQSTEHMCYIKPDEWNILCGFLSSDVEIAVTRIEEESGLVTFLTQPEVCRECCSARNAQEMKERLEYKDAKLYVRKVTSNKDLPGSIDRLAGPTEDKDDPLFSQGAKRKKLDDGSIEVPIKNLQTDESITRRSTRHRKTRGEKEIIVSSSQTLRDLKIQILRNFSVAPFDQNLSLDGRALIGDTETLAALNIIPESIIYLKADEPCHEDPMLIEDLSRVNYPEEGFKGTGLLGGK
ncbi:unnamed protein product [Owenia fusiformis]|uniref:Ubiquitin carboxyl-terminal hydrolase 48 n=1 Tax=Owenia fusiformis TaxID=6347 RepID=A0A8S4N2L4_OWEFU|nr:unnamed protein product [Owenia fusiformis]